MRMDQAHFTHWLHFIFLFWSERGKAQEQTLAGCSLLSVSLPCSLQDGWGSQVGRNMGSGAQEETGLLERLGLWGLQSGGEASLQTAVVSRFKKNKVAWRPSFKLLALGLLKDRQPGTHSPEVRSCSKILTRLKISCGLNFNFKWN